MIFENGNLGNSGFVNVGASAVVQGLTITSPATATTGHVHHSAVVVPSQGSGAGQVELTYNGITYAQTYNVPATGHPVVINLPLRIASGAATLAVTLRATAGFSTGITYSALRVTI